MTRNCTAAALAAAPLLLLAQCRNDDEAPAPAAAAAPVFPAGPLPPPYEPPADGDFVPRYVEHLLRGTRESLHASMDRLAAAGPAAVPALLATLEPRVRDPQAFANVVSLCQALGRCGDPGAAPMLLRVLHESSVPVCRSTAVEALQALAPAGIAPDLVALLRQETEIAVRERLIETLGVVGGEEAGAWLEQMLRASLDPGASADVVREGTLAWSSLLALHDPGAAERLRRLSEEVGPILRLQALIARRALGEAGLEDEIATYLDPDRYPSGKLRALAVASLAAAGRWDAVLAAGNDPDAQVRRAAARSLSDPGAPPSEAVSALTSLSRDPDADTLKAALHSLLLRGDRRELEPWLRTLREYPLGAGSSNALNLLAEPDLADPRTSAILIQRWAFCDGTQRVDSVRALGGLKDPASVEHLGKVLADPQEELEVRQAAGVALANFGAAGVEPLLQAARGGLGPGMAGAVLPSLARLARESTAAAEFLSALPADTSAPDLERKLAIELLPKALQEACVAPLLAARDAEKRAEVRGAIDRVLSEFF